MFTAPPSDLLRIVIVGVCAYVGLVVLLRITGKRTLTKLNAFDLVVTVALGSTLATVLLDGKVSVAEGLTAFALLIGMQFAVTWMSVRWPRFQSFVKASPSLLLYKGAVVEEALRRERVTREEVLAAARSSGASTLEELHAVILETDGSLSVLRKAPDEEKGGTLATVARR